MNIIKRAWLWLITKHDKEVKVSEPLNDTAVTTAPVVTETTVEPPVVNSSVANFDEAFAFVRDGVAKLGTAAESELIALAKKYL